MAKKTIKNPSNIPFKINTICDAINEYMNFGKVGMENELEICGILLSKNSGLSPNEKAEIAIKGGHQRRLQCKQAQSECNHLISVIAGFISNLNNGFSYTTFEDLYDAIDNLITTQKCKYARHITKYDIAKRIGSAYNCMPKQYVYLHRGSLEGARRLFNNSGLKEGRYNIACFSKYFGNLDSVYIEDMLCIFHEDFYPGGIISDKTFKIQKNTQPCHLFWVIDPLKTNANQILKNSGSPLRI